MRLSTQGSTQQNLEGRDSDISWTGKLAEMSVGLPDGWISKPRQTSRQD